MEEKVGKGAIILVISGLVCKIFGAFFRLPLANIIGIEGIGIFQMTMSIYSLMLIFISSGVTSALSKLVASARADGDKDISDGKINSGIENKMAASFSKSVRSAKRQLLTPHCIV